MPSIVRIILSFSSSSNLFFWDLVLNEIKNEQLEKDRFSSVIGAACLSGFIESFWTDLQNPRFLYLFHGAQTNRVWPLDVVRQVQVEYTHSHTTTQKSFENFHGCWTDHFSKSGFPYPTLLEHTWFNWHTIITQKTLTRPDHFRNQCPRYVNLKLTFPMCNEPKELTAEAFKACKAHQSDQPQLSVIRGGGGNTRCFISSAAFMDRNFKLASCC